MSMHPEQEQFEDLRRLLALKRHEQPPPGYFKHFSREVIVRIQAGDFAAQETAGKRLFWDFPFLQRLWDSLEARPALSAVFSVAVLGFLTAGFLLSDNSGLGQPALVGGVVPWPEGRTVSKVSSPPAFVTQAPGLEFSGPTGPKGVRARPNLFPPKATLVKFTLPNGN